MTEPIIIALSLALLVLVATAFGVTLLLSYMVTRMMGNKGWDQSNATNALRLLSHVVLHPEDFGKMYYLTDTQLAILRSSQTAYDEPDWPKRPFWYVDKDELSEVVRTRP